jgi:glycosyltransferase involved in cell wall biosynthesis
MRTTLVSVIIPVYNRYEQLEEAVNSVLRQTIDDYEIIIVDDGSKDERIEWFSVSNGLKYYKIEHSGMPGFVRNRGFEIARGNYIAFLDSDDLWNIYKLEKQLKYLKENPEFRIVHTKEIWIRNGKLLSQKKQKHKRAGDIFSDALKKCIVGPSTVLLESALFEEFGGFREDIEIAEDYELWLRVLSKHEIGYIDESLIIKRDGDWEQLSKKYNQIEIFRINGLKALIENGYFQGEKSELAKEELLKKIKIYMKGLQKRGKTEEYAKWEKYLLKYN